MKAITLFLAIFFYGGAFGQELIWVFLNKKVDKEELPEEQVKKIMDGHMANINRLDKEGKLLAAGPFEGGGGIFIFKSISKDEVNDWLSTDPGVQAKRWDVEVFKYTPRIGSVCAVGESYEMTNYWFVRYSVQAALSSMAMMEKALELHQEYIAHWASEGSVIAEGMLDEEVGSILVLKNEPTVEMLKNDPAVKSATLNTDLKKLFIAGGSFCELKP